MTLLDLRELGLSLAVCLYLIGAVAAVALVMIGIDAVVRGLG